MIEHALRSLLVSDTGVTGYVNDRIYYNQALQEVDLPYIVMIKVSSPRVHSHQGYSSLANPRIQLSVFSRTYLEAKQITRAIQRVLQGYRGVSENVHIQMCLYVNEVDIYETQHGYHHIAVDYEIFHREIIESSTDGDTYEAAYEAAYEATVEEPVEETPGHL